MHLLHSADRDVLAALVRAICRHEDVARLVAAEGVVVTGKDGQRVRHPAAIIEREAGETVRRLAREFGLTPSGRPMEIRAPRRRDHPVDHAQRTALHHRTHPVPGC